MITPALTARRSFSKSGFTSRTLDSDSSSTRNFPSLPSFRRLMTTARGVTPQGSLTPFGHSALSANRAGEALLKTGRKTLGVTPRPRGIEPERHPPEPPLLPSFPYTTLSRSRRGRLIGIRVRPEFFRRPHPSGY